MPGLQLGAKFSNPLPTTHFVVGVLQDPGTESRLRLYSGADSEVRPELSLLSIELAITAHLFRVEAEAELFFKPRPNRFEHGAFGTGPCHSEMICVDEHPFAP